MKKFRIRYLTSRTDKNGVRYYWQPSAVLRRAGFVLTRLSDDRSEAVSRAMELNAAVDEWMRGERLPFACDDKRHPESFDALVAAYRASTRWRRLAPKTQRDYARCLDILHAKFGKEIVRFMNRADILSFYEDEYIRRPAVANACMRVLRLVLQHAVNHGWLKFNPALKPGLVSSAPRQEVWPIEAENAFVEAAFALNRPSVAAAFILSAYLGQRQGDILKLTPTQFKDGCFRLRQSKTKVWVEVPAHKRVRDILSRLTRRGERTIVCSEATGKPYKADHFRKLFRRVINRAEKEHPEIDFGGLQFMDLRRTAVVRLAEAGATEAEISAVTGHKIETCRQILEVYLPRNGRMAANAIRKLEFAV